MELPHTYMACCLSLKNRNLNLGFRQNLMFYPLAQKIMGKANPNPHPSR